MSVPKTLLSVDAKGLAGAPDRGSPVEVASPPAGPLGAGVGERRRRSRASIAVDDLVCGARPEALARPAGEVLGAMPWAGATPDPDALDAMTFLAWL